MKPEKHLELDIPYAMKTKPVAIKSTCNNIRVPIPDVFPAINPEYPVEHFTCCLFHGCIFVRTCA